MCSQEKIPVHEQYAGIFDVYYIGGPRFFWFMFAV